MSNTLCPVGESKLRFVRSNVQVFYAFISWKSKVISYPECFKMLFRLEGALRDNKELQFDLTFSVFWQSPILFPLCTNCFYDLARSPPSSQCGDFSGNSPKLISQPRLRLVPHKLLSRKQKHEEAEHFFCNWNCQNTEIRSQ